MAFNGDLSGGDLSRLPAAAVHAGDEERSGGIVLSALAFGLAHLYQGVPQSCRLRCWESWAGSWRTGTRAFGPE